MTIISLEHDPRVLRAMSELENNPQVQDLTLQRIPVAWGMFLALRMGNDLPPVIPPPKGEILAYVNHGRWIAECPYCSAAQVASKSEPVYWCAECVMVWNDGAPVNVKFPDDAEAIEAALVKRPAQKNRNWNPHETVADLRRQNFQHGIADEPPGEDFDLTSVRPLTPPEGRK
jgi:hypothetical protein